MLLKLAQILFVYVIVKECSLVRHKLCSIAYMLNV